MPTQLDNLLDRLVAFFTSLRLTVICLTFGMLLVFAGTMAQVEMGLYRAQNEFFRSFFVYWGPAGSSWKIPVFPGGYLIGGLLLINLVGMTLTRFKLSRQKAGIWLIHVGLILLLVGQLLTDMLARESGMQLFEGESKNYSEDFRATELVLIDKSDPKSDQVYSVPSHVLANTGNVSQPQLPLTLKVKKFWANASLVRPSGSNPPMAVSPGATVGDLKDLLVIPERPVANADTRNTPAAVIEIQNGAETVGSFLVSSMAASSQAFTAGGKPYEIALRPVRYYYPFSVTLLKATHEKYRGTDIPKNFASRVRVENPSRKESRETVIYMNNPLRYAGQTFYQYQMSAGEMASTAGATPSSTFQVVRNPGWLTPYLSCVLISLGLMVQFGTHLFGFAKRRTQ